MRNSEAPFPLVGEGRDGMRTFIAIELEDEIKEELLKAQQQVQKQSKGGNFVPKENFHITLHFVGETEDSDLDYLKQAIYETAMRNRCFDMTLERVGFFQRGEKGIFWVGMKESKELMRLFSHLEKNLLKEGFAREKKGLSPHITLGREVIPYRSFMDIVNHTKVEKKTIHVTKISLMESVRIGGKLVYKPLFQQFLKEQ